jgi:hypothetical protein
MTTILFPRKGDRLRAHSVFFQATRVAASGIGVTGGMVPSRSSASAVAVSAGTYLNDNAPGAYAGGSLTGIPAASSGKLRFDLVVFDVSDTTLKRIPGDEDTPPVIGEFLENSQPLPPELGSASQILLAIIRVSSSGIEDTTHGHYATNGMAKMTIEVPGLASTSKHGLMQKYPNTAQALKGDGSWLTRNFEIDFPFGNGQDVIETGLVQEFAVPIPCKIISFDIWEVGPVYSSASCNLYRHNIGAAKGDVIWNLYYNNDTKKIGESADISVSAHQVLRFEVASITAAKQIVCRIQFEAT